MSFKEYASKEYIDKAIANHEYSWNDLSDKPFGDAVLCEWRSDAEYQESVVSGSNTMVKISDNTPAMESLVGETITTGTPEGTQSMSLLEDNFFEINDAVYLIAEMIVVALEDTVVAELGGVALTKGIWVPAAVSSMFSSLSISGGVKCLDEKFIPDTIARKSDVTSTSDGFSGSWNDLTDKPFSEGASYEWNKDTVYQESVSNELGTFVKISDDAPAMESLIGKQFEIVTTSGTQSGQITNDMVGLIVDNLYFVVDCILVVLDDAFVETAGMTKGMWHISGVEELVSTKISDDGIKQLDEKFIPDTIARVSDIPTFPDISYPVTSVNGQTGDVVIEVPENYVTSEELSDYAKKTELPVVDPTLSVEGQAADAKAVGEAIGSIEHIVATDDGNGIITLSLSPLTPADREVF